MGRGALLVAPKNRALIARGQEAGVLRADLTGTDVLEEGDLVVEVNRKATPDAASYRRVVGALAAGEAAWITVYRPSQRTSFLTRVEVEKRP